MSRFRLNVVLSQAQSKNPVKRALEESIVAALIMEPGLEVAVVPYLYDIDAEHTARLFLESIHGDMVVLAWNFPRAAFWVLDRDGIKGHFGESLLKPADGLDDEEEEESEESQETKGIGAMDVPDRYIYCIDLRNANKHEVFLEEVRRIAAECRQRREAKPAEPAKTAPAIVNLGLNLIQAGSSTNGNGAANGTAPKFSPDVLLEKPGVHRLPVRGRVLPLLEARNPCRCLHQTIWTGQSSTHRWHRPERPQWRVFCVPGK